MHPVPFYHKVTLSLFLIGLPLWASDFKVETQVLPTIVSGSLTPLILSIDGVVVVKSNEQILSVQVQDKVYDKKTMGKAPLYQKITQSKFAIVLNWKDKEREELHYELPTLEKVEFLGERFDVKTSTNTKEVTLNGKDPKTDIKKDELNKIFVFELHNSESSLTRLYNVTVEEIPPPPERISKEFFLNVSYTLFEPYRKWFHVGGGLYLPSRWAFSVYFEIALPRDSIWGRFGMGARAGYQLFRGTSGDNDPIWFEPGLSVRGIFHYLSHYEGQNPGGAGNVKRGLQIGPYLKTVPLRFRNWGLGATLETEVLMNTIDGGGATIMQLELYYHL